MHDKFARSDEPRCGVQLPLARPVTIDAAGNAVPMSRLADAPVATAMKSSAAPPPPGTGNQPPLRFVPVHCGTQAWSRFRCRRAGRSRPHPRPRPRNLSPRRQARVPATGRAHPAPRQRYSMGRLRRTLPVPRGARRSWVARRPGHLGAGDQVLPRSGPRQCRRRRHPGAPTRSSGVGAGA
jgi:hypothetical protein